MQSTQGTIYIAEVDGALSVSGRSSSLARRRDTRTASLSGRRRSALRGKSSEPGSWVRDHRADDRLSSKSQISKSPASSRNKNSDRPSPLKSPVATTFQLPPGLPSEKAFDTDPSKAPDVDVVVDCIGEDQFGDAVADKIAGRNQGPVGAGRSEIGGPASHSRRAQFPGDYRPLRVDEDDVGDAVAVEILGRARERDERNRRVRQYRAASRPVCRRPVRFPPSYRRW